MPRCAGFKPDNTQCERIVDDRSTYCYSHDPARKEQRRRAASKAGSVSKVPTAELAGYKGNIKRILGGLLQGEVDKGVASVAFQGFGLLIRAVEVDIKGLEARVKEREFVEIRKPEFEQLQGEVEELKEMLAEKESRGRRGSAWAG